MRIKKKNSIGLLKAFTPLPVKDLAEKRWIAKQEKDWAESDRLRDAVVDEGWVIKDSKDGYELEPS